MGLLDRLVKGALARKARRKLGSWAPLLAGVCMLAGFILQTTGNVAASDFAMQAYAWLGVDSPVRAETLVALRDAVNALVPELLVLLAPVTGAGAAYKLAQKRKDASGHLSKPPVLSNEASEAIDAADPKAYRFMRQWRHLVVDEGLSGDAAAREARRRVYGHERQP